MTTFGAGDLKSRMNRFETNKPAVQSNGDAGTQPAPAAAPAKKKFQMPKREKCRVCNIFVYEMEKLVADEVVYHKTCFKCKKCRNTLRVGNYASLDGQVFCKPHFIELFKQKGNYEEGFGKQRHKNKWLHKQGSSDSQSSSKHSSKQNTPEPVSSSTTHNSRKHSIPESNQPARQIAKLEEEEKENKPSGPETNKQGGSSKQETNKPGGSRFKTFSADKNVPAPKPKPKAVIITDKPAADSEDAGDGAKPMEVEDGDSGVVTTDPIQVGNMKARFEMEMKRAAQGGAPMSEARRDLEAMRSGRGNLRSKYEEALNNPEMGQGDAGEAEEDAPKPRARTRNFIRHNCTDENTANTQRNGVDASPVEKNRKESDGGSANESQRNGKVVDASPEEKNRAESDSESTDECRQNGEVVSQKELSDEERSDDGVSEPEEDFSDAAEKSKSVDDDDNELTNSENGVLSDYDCVEREVVDSDEEQVSNVKQTGDLEEWEVIENPSEENGDDHNDETGTEEVLDESNDEDVSDMSGDVESENHEGEHSVVIDHDVSVTNTTIDRMAAANTFESSPEYNSDTNEAVSEDTRDEPCNGSYLDSSVEQNNEEDDPQTPVKANEGFVYKNERSLSADSESQEEITPAVRNGKLPKWQVKEAGDSTDRQSRKEGDCGGWKRTPISSNMQNLLSRFKAIESGEKKAGHVVTSDDEDNDDEEEKAGNTSIRDELKTMKKASKFRSFFETVSQTGEGGRYSEDEDEEETMDVDNQK